MAGIEAIPAIANKGYHEASDDPATTEHAIDVNDPARTDKSELQNEPIPSSAGDLSPYRSAMDTPWQACFVSGFGLFNQFTSILVNFFVNVGAEYGGAYGHDYVGVWRTPPTSNPYGLQVWSDFLMTSILVVAGMGLLATPGQWASIWMGQARPIPGRYVSGPNASKVFKYSLGSWYPKGAKNFLVRTVLLVLQFSTVYYGIMMLIFFGMCKSNNIFAGPGAAVGSNPGRGQDPQCWIDPVIYIWVRAAVFTVFGAVVYPIAYVQALDVENVPAWALNAWKNKQQAALNKSSMDKQSPQQLHPTNGAELSPESTTRTSRNQY